jgi:6-phosphofructokinase
VKVVAIPKTMDNDVPGTDYCIGFGTCVARTIALAAQVRTAAASHERIVVLEVFGRYAGYTALLPTLAGAAQRCAIPEHAVDIERLTELIVADRNAHPDKLATVLVSEGAALQGGDMVFEGGEKDMFGHAKLGGIGPRVSAQIKERSAKYNGGRRIDMISMNLGYLVRSGDPDVLDATVPLAYGNLAMERVLAGDFGTMVCVRDGRYGRVPIDTVVASKKVVDVARYYDTERYRPRYDAFELQPMLVVGSS